MIGVELSELTDFYQYQELINEIRTPGQRVTTNCYLLPGDLKKNIELHKLSWIRISTGILILRENRDFYNLYYFLASPLPLHDQVDLSGLRKPVTIDILTKTTDFSKVSVLYEDFWQRSGFRFFKRNFRFHLDLPSGDRESLFHLYLDPNYYDHRQIREEEIAQVNRLWRNALDPYSVAFLDEEMMKDCTATQRVYCICDKEDHVVAAYRMEIKGKTAIFWQVVVEKNHREMAKALDILNKQYLIHPEITRFEFWVDEGNIKVIRAMRKLGYVQDPLINIQYIYNPR